MSPRSTRRIRRPRARQPDAQSSSTTKLATGQRIREIRLQRKLTLQELGKSTHIAPSTLSKIENGVISPGFDKVLRICNGLGLDISDLLNQRKASDAPPPMARQCVTRRGQGKVLKTHSGFLNEYVCSGIAKKAMIPSILTLQLTMADKDRAGYTLSRHPGEEYVYVIEGTAIILLEHYEPVELHEGDSLYFDSAMGHMYLKSGSRPTRILSVNVVPGGA